MNEELFKKIWKEAEEMQDLRDDEGHALRVTEFAKKLCKLINSDDTIAIPAATLHDIGYFGMNKTVLRDMMTGKLEDDEVNRIKQEHMKNGAKLAGEILKKFHFDEDKIEKIIEIIKKHDNSGPCSSIEEKIVRDSDKLWRYSKEGFNLDIKRRNCKPAEWYNYLKGNLSKEGYFQLEKSKEIALKELQKRRKEFETDQ